MEREMELNGMITTVSDHPDFLQPVFKATIKVMDFFSKIGMGGLIITSLGAITSGILLIIYGGTLLIILTLACTLLIFLFWQIFKRTTIICGKKSNKDGEIIGEDVYIITEDAAPLYGKVFEAEIHCFRTPEFDKKLMEYSKK